MRIKLGTQPPTSTTPRRPSNGSTKIIHENRHLQTRNQTMEFGIRRDNVSDEMTMVRNRLSTPPAPFPSTMHNDLHWTFCHEEQCSTHEKEKQEKIYYPPGENGYPHDHCYCGKEQHPDLDEIIRTQQLNPRKACRRWQRGRHVCHTCGFLVNLEGHVTRCNNPRLPPTSPYNYDSRREITPIDEPHSTLIHNSEAKEPPLREPVVLERVQREQPGVVLERVQREYSEQTPNRIEPTTPPTHHSSQEAPFHWRTHHRCPSIIHGHNSPRRIEKPPYQMHPSQRPRNNQASLIGASAFRGGLMSRISDDMLLGAIAASLGIWVTGVTITICYLVIRN
jgi:hypothetical protein